MALNIAQRPQGVVLSTTPLSATITNSSGDALVTYTSHGLSSGDKIFITSDYSYYNGFWEAVYIGVNTFKLRRFTYDTALAYVVDASVTFYKTQSTHYFSSVHLPIVYRLQSTLWPTNQADTTRTMTVTNSAGYCAIVASGDIKSTGSAQELEYVKITTVAGTYDGVYKIIDYSSDTSFTIDLEYSAAAETSLELGTSTIQYYYSNYHAKIRIYAGITGTGAVIKPVELITEVEAVPDSDSIITLNINEFLKSKVDILLNDPALVTMPRDIHAFCEFYITYAESYDITLGGYTLGTYVSSYTDDSGTVGYAVNSKLPFKNRYSGFMSEYLGNARKFLTMFTEPVLFVGNYYDIGFINNANGIELRRQRYLNDSLVGTSYDNIPNYEEGVYRKQVSQELTEDRIDVSLVSRPSLQALSGWLNLADTGTDWTTGANPSVTLAISDQSDFLYGTFAASANIDYTFTYNIDANTAGSNGSINIIFFTSGFTTASINNVININATNLTGTITLSALLDASYVGIIITNGAVGSLTVDINSITISETVISEIKTIEVNSDCSNQDLYLTWKNPLGGHDYWKFTAEKEYGVDILDVQESEKNIITDWPKSFGEFADTVSFDISRTSKDTILVRSQNLTLGQAQAMKYIKTSPLVQIMTSKTDRRTVKVDQSSFIVYSETDKLYGIQFTITYTDDIPSQSL
jgi:hypothetical protein